MSLIRTEIKTEKNEIIKTYYATKIIPPRMTKIFLEAFIDEKLNIINITQSYLALKSLKMDDLYETFYTMTRDFSRVTFVLEVFYFDSSNNTKNLPQQVATLKLDCSHIKGKSIKKDKIEAFLDCQTHKELKGYEPTNSEY